MVIQEEVNKLLQQARSYKYTELYELYNPVAVREIESLNDIVRLDDVIRSIIVAFGNPVTDDQAWYRLGFMGCEVLGRVEATIAARWPVRCGWPLGCDAARAVHVALDRWLSGRGACMVGGASIQIPLGDQAISEAMSVVANVNSLMDRVQAQNAMCEMLDTIFQGYAIFPGSEGRRALFDWWLDILVPAALDFKPKG